MSHARTPLATILEKLQAAAARPFKEARPIPGVVNHSPEFLSHERQTVFMQEWICVGRADEISAPGDYLTHQIADVPVVVIRQEDGQVRAFVNACAHRFACLLPCQKGSAKRFTCRYHAWTYDLGGRLIAAPYMEMKEDFDKSNHGLRPLHAEIWEGFIYISLAAHPARTLAASLEPLRTRIVGQYDMARYQTVLRETMVWNANWKNLIENFTESYHVPIAHRKTFALHSKPLTDYVCGEDYDYFGYHHAAQPSDTGSGAAHPDNDRLEGEWRRTMVDFCVFPCHLVTLMPDYLWYITVQPHGVDQMRATWSIAVPPEILADIPATEYESWLAQFKTYIDVANEEDKVLVEALHTGSASPLLPDGTFHPIERNLWQFMRYLARMTNSSE